MNMIRNQSSPSFLIALPLLGLLCRDASAAPFKSTPGARCDLVSAAVQDTSSCIDVSALDGATLRVPAHTTRISTGGLILCGKKEQTTDPMDIVYVVDQSNSMLPNSIVATGTDTVAFYNCGSPFIDASTPITSYHGVNVFVIPSSMATSAKAACSEAGDPTSIRDKLVKDAIVQQAALSPGSEAAWVPFSALLKRRYMVDLSDATAMTNLQQTIRNYEWGGTSYGGPIAWARLLLDGGTSSTATTTMPGSKNPRKAIFFISDGEPTDSSDYLKDLQTIATVKDSLGNVWSTSSAPTPPVYGFMLTESNRSGKVLQTIANSTGGQFFQIPPSRPDSLKRTLSRILGSLMGTGRPDSLRISNLSNGQTSYGLSAGREAGGFRIKLDSIVGLQPGRNTLDLRFVLTGLKDSIVTARWTIDVSDPASDFSQQGTDSVLEARCHAPSSLVLRPAKDLSRTYADTRDTLIRVSLSTRVENQLVRPIGFTTDASRDSGTALLRWAILPATPEATTSRDLSWLLAPAILSDTAIQTGNGIDTLRAVFRMPRDPRDSATALLPLLRPRAASIRFVPDASGSLDDTLGILLDDGDIAFDTATVSVVHRSGDVVPVLLHRASSTQFRGRVRFRQGIAVVPTDSVMQTGPFRADARDTLVVVHGGSASDSAILSRPAPGLRFVDASGAPIDSLVGANLDVGESTDFGIGAFIGDIAYPSTDSVLVGAPSWISVPTGVRLVGGRASIRIVGAAPGSGGRVRMNLSGSLDSLVFQPVQVSAQAIWFAPRSSSSLSDTLGVFVRDANALQDSVVALVVHRAGDTVAVTLRRTVGNVFHGTVRFQQGAPTVKADSVLQAGPFRTTLLDSLVAIHRVAWRDTAVLSRPAAKLRFVDSAGRPFEAHPGMRLELGSQASFSVGLFVGDLPWISTDSLVLVPPPWISAPSGLRLVAGQAVVRIGGAAPGTGGRIRMGILGSADSLVLSPVDVAAYPPDSALYLDSDGDGALDKVRVHFRTRWNPSVVLGLSWPDALHPLPLSGSVATPSGDSLVVEFAFGAPVAPGTTTWNGAPLPGTWTPAAGASSKTFPVMERIAPVPLHARIARGGLRDTLRVASSEAIDPASLASAAALVRRLAPGAGDLATSDLRWDPATRTLLLVYASDSIDALVVPGDSIRFSQMVRDPLGNAPGVVAPRVIVTGNDHPPVSAEVVDMDADGRADHVVLRFSAPPRVSDTFEFGWSDGTGNVLRRVARRADATSDPSGRILTFSVDPFPFGATSCPSSGCASLGAMSSSRWPGEPAVRFDETDAVPAVILQAELRFGIGGPDTILATLSEPVSATPGTEWLRWGRPSLDSAGMAIPVLGQAAEASSRLTLLVDPALENALGDSIRIAAPPRGSVRDGAGVSSPLFSHWTPLRIGQAPPSIRVSAWPAFADYDGWAIPPSEAPLQMLVRSDDTKPWRTLDGTALAQDPSRYVGILIHANREVGLGGAYLYDNAATFVAYLDLAPLDEAISNNGRVETTVRGDYQVWIAWNGLSRSGTVASSGVYPMRLVFRLSGKGQGAAYNTVQRLGWKTATE